MQDKIDAANDVAVELISSAEAMFGPMTSSWTYDGVIFQDHPPHLSYSEDGYVSISLSLKALEHEWQRDFQLSHEACHLLYPSVTLENLTKPSTNVINEGISTYFSLITLGSRYQAEIMEFALENLKENSSKYFFAFMKVSELLKIDRNSIKTIRKIQPLINDLQASDLYATDLHLSDDLIKSLVADFNSISNQSQLAK